MPTEPIPDLAREAVPRTFRSLFQLRILLCVAAASLGLGKILFSPPLSTFFVEVFADPSAYAAVEAWQRAANLVISGLLAVVLALVIATLFIQARLQTQVEKEARAIEGTV